MRTFGILTAINLLRQLIGTTTAQSVQILLWKVPDGTSPDLSLTFTNGVTLPLSWNNWSSPSYIDASTTLVDLWATSYDYNINKYAEILKESIDLTVAGNFAWTIAVPDKYLSVSAKYVLRFKEPAAKYSADTADLSSPGFLVLKATNSLSTTKSPSIIPTSTSTSSSITATSVTTSQPASTTPAASASTDPPATTPMVASQQQLGLNTGAKAGLGVGISLVVLAIVALVAFLLRRRKIPQQPVESPVYMEEKSPGGAPAEAWVEPVELSGGRVSVRPSELHGS
ncbi:hypothetical protein FKW77_008789 [Venturia effusa]|uniref:Mid2 domain-containing protein n=1 Tax=Venturia effusa TaxID=50376 RepID=A0A517LCS7_9PEZI|nr:hypothetical protein FKW77_008789 [Venturia effusa]